MIEVAPLIVEVSPDSPCGPNLEYDAEFTGLMLAASGTPERQMGSTVVPAKEPEWRDVQERARKLLTRTKDLRVAMLLTHSLVRTDGLDGLASGLALTGEMLTRYWDGVHPVIDKDPEDPTARLSAIAPLAFPEKSDPSALLRDVWGVTVASSPNGRVSVRDILIAKSLVTGTGPAKMSSEELTGMLKDIAATGPLPVDAAKKSVEALDVIRSCVATKVKPTDVPSVQTVADELRAVAEVLRAASGGSEEKQTAGASDASSSAAGQPTSGGTTELRGREDVIKQLDRVCEFIQRTEPGNPAPLLIRRAQRLLSKDFLEIIKDLAPGSLGEVQKIAGIDKG